jgi:hypothetical protein
MPLSGDVRDPGKWHPFCSRADPQKGTTMLTYSRRSLLTLAFILSTTVGTVDAAGPDGVLRTFAVVTYESVDFSSDDSVLVKTKKVDVTPSVKEYADADNPDLDGTQWSFGSPGVMYITKGQGDTAVGSFAWLLSSETPDPPPVGAVAMMGPDALVIQQDLGPVSVQGNFITPSANPLGNRMIVVTAVFNR